MYNSKGAPGGQSTLVNLLITFTSLHVFVCMGHRNPWLTLNPLNPNCTEFRSDNPENLRARHETSMAECDGQQLGRVCSIYAESLVSCLQTEMVSTTGRFEENRNRANIIILYLTLLFQRWFLYHLLKRLHFWLWEQSFNDLRCDWK